MQFRSRSLGLALGSLRVVVRPSSGRSNHIDSSRGPEAGARGAGIGLSLCLCLIGVSFSSCAGDTDTEGRLGENAGVGPLGESGPRRDVRMNSCDEEIAPEPPSDPFEEFAEWRYGDEIAHDIDVGTIQKGMTRAQLYRVTGEPHRCRIDSVVISKDNPFQLSPGNSPDVPFEEAWMWWGSCLVYIGFEQGRVAGWAIFENCTTWTRPRALRPPRGASEFFEDYRY
jgi:hypothetical protein